MMAAFAGGVLEIEFTAGVWTDVSAYYRTPVKLKFGRATPYEDTGAASMTVRLDNFDGRFMPDFMGSPYYPNVVKGKRVRWKVTKSAVTYTRHLGWIQAWEPHFPTESTNDAYVDITSVDSLGLLAQKKLKSNWTEKTLWYARANSLHVDAYEASGQVNGYAAFMTNYSPDAGKGTPGALYGSSSPLLTFTNDPAVSCGPVVQLNSSADGHTCGTSCGIQTGSLCISFLLKVPNDVVSGTCFIASILDGGGSTLGHLAMGPVGGTTNWLAVRDAPGTTDLGSIINVPLGAWVGIAISQNQSTASHSDWSCGPDLTNTGIGGSVFQNGNVNIDVRSVARIQFPGSTGFSPKVSVGGVTAYSDHQAIAFAEGACANVTRTATLRMTDLANAVSLLPLSFTQVGGWSGSACTGNWSERTALDVAQEIARSVRATTTGSPGLMFGRPRDSQVLAISGDATRPDTPLLTVNASGEVLSGIDMASAVDQTPTRVTVSSPATTALVIDTAAEAAGQSRAFSTTTVNISGFSDAADIANFYLRRNNGLRFSQLKIDLTTAASDPTAVLWDESGTNSGLFPTARVRVAELPATHFSYPTRDVHVEGWTESFEGTGNVSIVADTSPAQARALASVDFTGTNGSGFPGGATAFDARFDSGGTGSALIQGNRGRITTPAAVGAYTVAELTSVQADGELVVQFTLQDAVVSTRVFLRANSGFATSGYYVEFSAASTTQTLWRRSGGVAVAVATWTQTLASATDYITRFRVADGWVNARAWAAAGTEAGTWSVAYRDGSPLSGGNRAGIGAFTSTATARSVDYDNLTLLTIT